MSLTVTDKGGASFKEIAADTYVARCVRIIDLGIQPESEYQGQKKKATAQVLVMWELPDVLIEDGDYAGQPRTIGRFYTASLNEKAKLREHLETWRGRKFTPEELEGFSLINVLGAPCMLSVVQNDSGKAKVGNVAKLMKGMTCPAQILPSVTFDLSAWLEGDPTQAKIYDDLSDGIKGLIDQSQQVRERMGKSTSSTGTANPDDIPF